MLDNPSTHRTVPNLTPLQPRPDQPQQWLSHATPIQFADAASIVLREHERDGRRTDIAATDLRAWTFGSHDGRSMCLSPIPLPGRAGSISRPLRDRAFAQLCTRLGAPAAYIRTLPPRLQTAALTWAMMQEPQNALLRLAGDEIRALVSGRYAPIDDPLVLEVLDDVLAKSGYRNDAQVRATATGPVSVLRVTVPNDAAAVRSGDLIEHGLDLANSELGLRAVQIVPISYRLVCTNGMRAWRSEAALRMRHVGDPSRLREQLRDAVPVALAEARGDLARWRKAADVLITDAFEEIESLRRHGLSSGEITAIGQALALASGLSAPSSSRQHAAALRMTSSAFDVSNAITSAARDRPDISERFQLESVGHRYLLSKVGS